MKNKEYDLLGMTIKVEYLDRVENENGCWVFGQCRFDGDNVTIGISTKSEEGKKISKKSMSVTLRHELFHAILAKGQYMSCSNDEPLVEWLALATSLLCEQGLKI